ncbi:MAG: hypothetical protein IT483_14430 [Gammaproteobacteria bacterium]|nr:hypothetical protein [Gammaproteobacteria bacterium]
MTRKRGRPKKFQGDKDKAAFPVALSATLPAVVDFIVAAHLAKLEPVQPHRNRRTEALEAVAEKHGLSERTLERRYAELRFLAEPMARAILDGQGAVALEIEYLPPA